MNQLGIKTIVTRVHVEPIPRLLGLCQRMRELSSGVIAWPNEHVVVDLSMRKPPQQSSLTPSRMWSSSVEEQFNATKAPDDHRFSMSGALIKDDHVSKTLRHTDEGAAL